MTEKTISEEVLFAGFGGQGVLLVAKLLAEAGMDAGFHATWFPSYGPEMRGGTCNCTVVYSNDEIGSPIASQYDTVIVLNQPSLEKFQPMVKPGGKIVVNSTLVNITNRRDDITYVEVPANALAIDAGSDKSTNIVALGAYHSAQPLVAEESIFKAIDKQFSAKGEKVVNMNHIAFKSGQEAVGK